MPSEQAAGLALNIAPSALQSLQRGPTAATPSCPSDVTNQRHTLNAPRADVRRCPRPCGGYAAGTRTPARSPASMWPAGQVIVGSPSRSSRNLTFDRIIATTRPASSYSIPWPSGLAYACAGGPL